MNLDASLRLYTRFGIEVRAHWILIFWVALEMIGALGRGGEDLLRMAAVMLFLFFFILLHEYGHCFAGRWLGLHADRIVLWPLGGLAFVDSPGRPSREAWVAAAGPLVDFTVILLMTPWLVVSDGAVGSYLLGIREEALYDDLYASVFAMNLDRFVFNLIPALPMDFGRILRAILWHRHGLGAATIACVWVARVSALLLFLAGLPLLLGGGLFLLLFALFIWFSAEQMRIAVRSGEEEPEEPWARELPGSSFRPAPGDAAPGLFARRREARRSRRAEKLARKRMRDDEELDRLLAKVHREGMTSLSARERRFLVSASRRRSGGH